MRSDVSEAVHPDVGEGAAVSAIGGGIGAGTGLIVAVIRRCHDKPGLSCVSRTYR
jgi:hypothetical protein